MNTVDLLRSFRQVWLVDFEFTAPPGERPTPICMVAREYHTGRTMRLWADALASSDAAPFRTDVEALFVAYFASAELSCFLALGWPMPARILDLFTEFRCLTNGHQTVAGNGLLGAMAHYGLSAIDSAEKSEMRDLAIRGGPFAKDERRALLDYCESDVLALAKLLPAMAGHIDLPRALLRGRYMAAVARMQSCGVPIDQETLDSFRKNWDAIKGRLIASIDAEYGVFIPTGSPSINPQSSFGAAVLSEAAEWGIEPHFLADAAGEVWRERQQQTGDFRDAIKAARKATGLTINRIEDWEHKGRDHSTWPDLDVKARELAAEYPALGIGRGYVADETYDDTDHAAELWNLLRCQHDRPIRKYDGEIMSEAAERVAVVPDGELFKTGPLSFSSMRFAEWLARNGIPWPRLASGTLALDDATFRQMARMFPEVAPLRELRHSLGELRLFADLAVGHDGRNRCLLSPFRSVTGRNQPSNAQFVFGPSCWLRGLIKPEASRAVAYVDWSQQEFGIAAALSGDAAMQAAYLSTDPYLTFAKQAGAVPSDATKQSHPREREQFKVCALAVQYGMGPDSLAQTLGQPTAVARELLRLHRTTYPTFWRWSEACVDHAMLRGWLHTVFGWRVHVGPNANPRSLANFPMQANGAEMLRLACCLATEAGIGVCCPVHDALLVEGPTDEIEAVVAATQASMREASRIVLDGFELRSDAEIVRSPDRYMDKRGRRMWETVTAIVAGMPQVEFAGVEDF
ncbi:MAG: DNA polymerase [Planctomycetota bacterium]|nr:DNA polymerase [Planctomycetota bacterium]